MASPAPDAPDDPLAPFRSVDLYLAARLEGNVDAGGYRRRQGFLRAAGMLLQAAVDAEDWYERDPLIWPGLYCFRHYMELQLKQLARDGLALGLEQPAHTHVLRRLWPPVRQGVERTLGAPEQAVRTVEQAVAVFEALDPGGDGLRYATRRDGAPSVPSDVYLEPAALLKMVDATATVLEAAELAFDYAVEALRDSWDSV